MSTTSLGGLGDLVRLTHLYAHDNRIESLDDFEAPPALQQLHIANNRLSVIGGLEGCTCLEDLTPTPRWAWPKNRKLGSEHMDGESVPVRMRASVRSRRHVCVVGLRLFGVGRFFFRAM